MTETPWPQIGEFHHIGVATANIEMDTAFFAKLGYRVEVANFEDPIQKIVGRFLVGGGPRIELVAPLSPDSPVTGVLKRGTRFYHQAFLVQDLEGALENARAMGGKVMVQPCPAVAFDNRRIAFFLTPSLLLIELISIR